MLVLLSHLIAPSRAAAQWYLGASIGANRNLDAAVSVRQPSTNLALDFHDVHFEAQSNYPRRYYTARLGRMGRSGLGFEAELIHYKAVGVTSRTYDVTVVDGIAPPAASPMNAVVQEYQMTHGVNLVLFNVVAVRGLGGSGSGRAALEFRAGAGFSLPHAESTVNGRAVHQYEYGGRGAGVGAGLRVRLLPRISALAEYKFTYTRPTIDIADGGTGWTTLWSHHATVGLSVGLTR
jgi:hypothetical protein